MSLSFLYIFHFPFSIKQKIIVGCVFLSGWGWENAVKKYGCVMLDVLLLLNRNNVIFVSLTLSLNNKLCVGINSDEKIFFFILTSQRLAKKIIKFAREMFFKAQKKINIKLTISRLLN